MTAMGRTLYTVIILPWVFLYRAAFSRQESGL